MPSEFRPTVPDDGPQIAQLARRLLGVAADSPMFAEQHMRFKYWSASDEVDGPRGYVLVRDDAIVAHAGVLPLRYRAQGRSFTLLHPFDWMSEPAAIGSGAALLSRLGKLADGLLIVGGSQTTQRMVRPLGFRALGDVSLYAAPVAKAPYPAPFDVRELAVDALPGPLQATAPWIAAEPQPAWLRACQRCPAAPMELSSVHRDARLVGALLLAFAPGQARIAAFWPASLEPATAAELLAAARQRAAGVAGVDEVVCMANAANDVVALQEAGFSAVGQVPMFVLAPRVPLSESDRLAFRMLDGDFAFLHDGQPRPWLSAGAGARPSAGATDDRR